VFFIHCSETTAVSYRIAFWILKCVWLALDEDKLVIVKTNNETFLHETMSTRQIF